MTRKIEFVSLEDLRAEMHDVAIEPEVCPELSQAFRCSKSYKECADCPLNFSAERVARLQMLVAINTAKASGIPTKQSSGGSMMSNPKKAPSLIESTAEIIPFPEHAKKPVRGLRTLPPIPDDEALWQMFAHEPVKGGKHAHYLSR